MLTETRRRAIRAAVGAFVLHSIFVIFMVAAYNALQWEFDGPWWVYRRVLRLVEFPVSWLVDPAVQTLPLLPQWAVFGRLWLAAAVSEMIAYGTFGGLFYSVTAAGLSLVPSFWRRKHKE